MNVAYNMNCMDAMRDIPDNAFDLAVVDPPYGDAKGGNPDRFGERFDRYRVRRTGCGRWEKYGNKIIGWDVAPDKDYFEQLFRISKNQIIWGGNYFELPPTRCFLIWRKTNVPQKFSMSMAEYAWTSFNDNAKVFDFSAIGIPNRFHPTQKPVELYEWVFGLFAKKGDKIIDTHMGSGSSRIASYRMGFDFVGYEIDKAYFDMQEERFAKEIMQAQLF